MTAVSTIPSIWKCVRIAGRVTRSNPMFDWPWKSEPNCWERYHDALDRAAKRKVTDILQAFEERCRKAEAVINRSYEEVLSFLSSDRELYTNWWQKTENNMRIPEGSQWDELRQEVDPKIFPYFYKKYTFASLSINRDGLWNYGPCSMVLGDNYIRNRTSVFECNTLTWYKNILIQSHRVNHLKGSGQLGRPT